MIRSLLIQLSAQSSPALHCLELAYGSSQNGQQQPTTAASTSLLEQVPLQSDCAFLLLDALDECKDRDELCELIAEIASWKLQSLHILATSRKEKKIEDCLQSLVQGQICIQSALVDADIRTLISDRLSTEKRWPTNVKQEIEETLVAGAHGM